MLRERFFKASDTDAFDTVGADRAWDDGLQDEDVLLAPAPFDALYPHYLCAMTDAALGETDRYAGEQAQYNGILAELAACCAGPIRRGPAPAGSGERRDKMVLANRIRVQNSRTCCGPSGA